MASEVRLLPVHRLPGHARKKSGSRGWRRFITKRKARILARNVCVELILFGLVIPADRIMRRLPGVPWHLHPRLERASQRVLKSSLIVEGTARASRYTRRAVSHGWQDAVNSILKLILASWGSRQDVLFDTALWHRVQAFSRRGVERIVIDNFGTAQVRRKIEIDGIETTEAWVKDQLRTRPELARSYRSTFFYAGFETYPAVVLPYGEAASTENFDPVLIQHLMSLYFARGQMRRELECARQLTEAGFRVRRLPRLADEVRILDEGAALPPRQPAAYTPDNPRRVLYLLHNALPYHSGGYATRAHGLLTALVRQGWDVIAVGRLGYPHDRVTTDAGVPAEREIDGVRYRYLIDLDYNLRTLTRGEYLDKYAERLVDLCRELKPAVLHAASFHYNGIAANIAGRTLGLPTIYEIRGLEDLTRMSRQPEWAGSDQYRLMRRLEVDASCGADAVMTITGRLRDLMVERGVPRDKIQLLPNGVNADRFQGRPRNIELARQLGFEGKVVIGFVGSMVFYEGLDYLMQAIGQLRRRGLDNFGVLMVGDGGAAADARALARELDLGDMVRFTGRVPHAQVEDYYSVIDIAPFPRKGHPVCEVVSPLKPFEAMAMRKAVIVSDVGALAEIVEHDVTGLQHRKDDVGDLADALERLVRDADLRRRLGEAARAWVERERSWMALAGRLGTLYETLASQVRR
ncbi:glycosyltransferase family 4 protein [Azospirillum sp.]|uniref:glycosyltransferase family 4 protein n=1 Tax=Azospirillum sp. TaxID=34012 RepID=UPI002D314582|nr:glycosyltransferase family 4 protein [Azospirillum sp.]HYD64544.1 glycosyltransferase family 4 protein [Azospirillum sp.]